MKVFIFLFAIFIWTFVGFELGIIYQERRYVEQAKSIGSNDTLHFAGHLFVCDTSKVQFKIVGSVTDDTSK